MNVTTLKISLPRVQATTALLLMGRHKFIFVTFNVYI
jgi:hypothetical protein